MLLEFTLMNGGVVFRPLGIDFWPLTVDFGPLWFNFWYPRVDLALWKWILTLSESILRYWKLTLRIVGSIFLALKVNLWPLWVNFRSLCINLGHLGLNFRHCTTPRRAKPIKNVPSFHTRKPQTQITHTKRSYTRYFGTGKYDLRLRGAAFFYSRENQKCAWNVFLAFYRVFSRTKNRFHAHYFVTFHGQNNFSRANFRIFSRMDFYLHGKKIDIFENFHVRVSFFHAIKKGPEFQPIEMKFRTRMIFWFLRIKIVISVWYLK